MFEMIESFRFRGVVSGGSGINDDNGDMVGESYPPSLIIV